MEAPRHIIRRAALAVSAVAVFAAAALGLAVPGASANTTITATTHLTNRLDGGHNTLGGGVWATDTMDRTAVLTVIGPDPTNSSYTDYGFNLSDSGTFVTNNNVGNPNGLNATTPITGTVHGTITGTGTWATFAVLNTDQPSSGLVPAHLDGNGTASSAWPSLFFPQGSTITCLGDVVPQTTSVESVAPCGEITYSYTYKSCTEQWVDANTDNDGDAVGQSSALQAIIGGISGEACPTPSPSPSHHKPSNGFPTGGVQTGGGTPASSSRAPLIAVLASLGMLIAAGFGIARLRRQRG